MKIYNSINDMKCHVVLKKILPLFFIIGSKPLGQVIEYLPHNDKSITVKSGKNFLSDYKSKPSADSVNVVVEIPAGSNAKWETDKVSGTIKWEIKNGKPRVIKYLSYPANYGIVPRTLLSRENGGDGDPVDVLLLGPSRKRGEVVSAQLIGVLKLMDNGKKDDKLIAIDSNSIFRQITSIESLNSKFIGISKILEIWMTNYKGPGKVVSKGFGNAVDANMILNTAIISYENTESSR